MQKRKHFIYLPNYYNQDKWNNILIYLIQNYEI